MPAVPAWLEPTVSAPARTLGQLGHGGSESGVVLARVCHTQPGCRAQRRPRSAAGVNILQLEARLGEERRQVDVAERT